MTTGLLMVRPSRQGPQQPMRTYYAPRFGLPLPQQTRWPTLGTLREARCHAGEAKEWYRNATDLGNTEAMFKLGILLKEQGRDDEGGEWHHKGRSEEVMRNHACRSPEQKTAARQSPEDQEAAQSSTGAHGALAVKRPRGAACRQRRG